MLKLTQQNAVLTFLLAGGTLTTNAAFSRLGVANPTAVIANLRHKCGFRIYTNRKNGRANYRLGVSPDTILGIAADDRGIISDFRQLVTEVATS